MREDKGLWHVLRLTVLVIVQRNVFVKMHRTGYQKGRISLYINYTSRNLIKKRKPKGLNAFTSRQYCESQTVTLTVRWSVCFHMRVFKKASQRNNILL